MGRLFTPWQICDFNVIRLRRDKVQTIVTRKKSPFHDIFSVKWMSFRFCSRKTAALQLGYKFMFAITFNHDLGRFFWMREVGMISRQARHWVAPKPKVRSRFCCCCSIFFVFVLFSQMCRPVSFNSRRLSICCNSVRPMRYSPASIWNQPLPFALCSCLVTLPRWLSWFWRIFITAILRSKRKNKMTGEICSGHVEKMCLDCLHPLAEQVYRPDEINGMDSSVCRRRDSANEISRRVCRHQFSVIWIGRNSDRL